MSRLRTHQSKGRRIIAGDFSVTAVGRIRQDCALDNGPAFWGVGDQLLKGAALNAMKIAERLV